MSVLLLETLRKAELEQASDMCAAVPGKALHSNLDIAL